MKFRTISRLLYLKKARHRRGHGIHSPFLFNLITTVIENKKRVPEYKIFRQLKFDASQILEKYSDQSPYINFPYIYSSLTKPQKLYKRIELQLRYGKVVFRLIREFKPSSVIHYGPALGVNLSVMALANQMIPVYQVIESVEYHHFTQETLKDSSLSNIHYLNENDQPAVHPELIMINYPYAPQMTQRIIQNSLEHKGLNDVIIIRGIHESKEMEAIWQELIANKSVRVSLDLFEIGIALFRAGLQKENFIHRF